MNRLDKNLFYDGLLPLSSRLDQRYYTTTLTLAHDLCDVIHAGINTEPDTPTEMAQDSVLGPPMPAKADYADYRDRKKLGKRILKAVQPQLEMALRLEAEANHRSFDGLKQELEAMIEASLEYRPKAVIDSVDGEGEQSQDVIMVDSSAAVIAVSGLDHRGLTTGDDNGDVTMADADNQAASMDGNIEVDTSAIEIGIKVEGTRATADVAAAPNSEAIETKPIVTSTNGIQSVNTPPATNGYVSAPPASQSIPPTPPQSNGSLGGQPMDALTDGGILWYLQEFELEGASAAEEQWNGSRDAVSSRLSEELTEIDDDELKGLGVEINEESITASPADLAPIVDGANHASPTKKASRSRKRKTTYRRR
jgi:NuA3 HAT complex component NTO1